MSKQRIASNLLIMGVGQLVTWALSTVYLILVGRYLGPNRQGELSLALSIVSVLGLMVGLGMDTLIMRTVARTPDRASRLVSAAIFTRGALAVLAVGILYLYVHVTHLDAETRLTAYLLTLSMIMGALIGVMLATFQGREQMSLGALGAIVQNACTLGLAILVIRLQGGVVAFAANVVLVEFVLLLLNLRWLRRFARLTWHISRQDARELVVGSLAFWANSVFLTIYIYIDSIILGALAGTDAVGIYAPATRMFSVALFLPGIIGLATMPLLSRLGADADVDFTRVSRKTLSLLIACAIPLTVGLATFAGPLILTLFGSAYRSSVPVLVMLSLCIPCTFLNIQVSQMLAARDQQWRWTVIMAVSCVVNPLLNLILIRFGVGMWHNGALGAALSLLVTEMLMAIYGAIVMRDVVFNRMLGRATAMALLGGGAQISILWLTTALWAPLSEALGVIVYGAAAVVFGILPREDLSLLWQTALGRTRRQSGRIDPGNVVVERTPPHSR